MAKMKKADYLSIDGHVLQTFLLILQTHSVTEAARRLGMTQSAVSHTLRRLRTLFDDPLFVRAGNRLVPTEQAESLKQPVQSALDQLRALSTERPFDPHTSMQSFSIAANDMQRELVFPRLIRDLDAQGIDAAFEFMPSGHPTPALLRSGRCHLALTPFPPETSDIIQKQIFEGQMMCFFDGVVRQAPATWEQYIRSQHVSVKFPDGGTSRRAIEGIDRSEIPKARVSVPNFGALPAFVKGSAMIATEMNLMKLNCLKGLDMAPLPFALKPVSIFMIWHIRDSSQPAHIWLREKVELIAKDVVAEFTAS